MRLRDFRSFLERIFTVHHTSDKSPYGNDAPWKLPQGWVWTKIGEIAFVTKLAGFEYTEYIANNLVLQGSNSVPLFKGKNIQDSKIIYEFESFIPEAISDQLERSQITKKCLLTPYVGALGNIAIHNKVGKFHLGSNVGKIEFYNGDANILEEYAHIYLQSSSGFAELTKHKKATAQESISIDAIRDVFIPLPPFVEQQRIVEEVEKYNALVYAIEKNQENLRVTISHAKVKILDLAIHGKLVPQDPSDEPAEALLKRINPKWQPSDNPHYPFDIPNGWSWAKMTDISTLERGGNFVKGDFVDDGYPCIHYGQIHTKFSFKTFDAITYISEDKASKQRKAHPNDIVMAITSENMNDVCKCTAWLGQYDVAVGAHAAIIRHYIDSMYLTYFFYSTCFGKQKEEIAHGSKVIEISPIGISSFQIPIPPVKEQQRIVAAIEKAFASLDAIQTQLKA